jgi:hypothetical protein
LGNHLIKISLVLVVLVLRDEFLLQQFVEILLSAIAESLLATAVPILANEHDEPPILDQVRSTHLKVFEGLSILFVLQQTGYARIFVFLQFFMG